MLKLHIRLHSICKFGSSAVGNCIYLHINHTIMLWAHGCKYIHILLAHTNINIEGIYMQCCISARSITCNFKLQANRNKLLQWSPSAAHAQCVTKIMFIPVWHPRCHVITSHASCLIQYHREMMRCTHRPIPSTWYISFLW